MTRLPEEQEQELKRLFYAEATEHVSALNRELMRLERAPDQGAEHIAQLLRGIHNLKGAAAAAGLPSIEMLCHDLESSATALAGGAVAEVPAALEALYLGLDAMDKLLQHECGLVAGPAPDISDATAALSATFGPHCELRSGSPDSAAATPGVDPEDSRDTEELPPWSPSGQEATSLRIPLRKLDRLMTNLEELMPLEAGGAGQLAVLDQLITTGRAQHTLASSLQLHLDRAARSGWRGRDVEQVRELAGEHRQAGRRLLDQLYALAKELRTHHRALARLTGRLQDDIRSVRMVPVQPMLNGFARMVRDVARKQGKQVSLWIEGSDVEIERDVLEVLRNALTHLIRNSVDHGIEEPADRFAAGKPGQGSVWLTTAIEGQRLSLTIADDGRGIVAADIRARIRERGLLGGDELARMSDDQVRMMIFRSGLSTATHVSEISGRGVGLDLVRELIDELGGYISMDTSEGMGTRFHISVPVSVATTRMLLVDVESERYALPSAAVYRVVRVAPADICALESGRGIHVDGSPVRLYRLADILELGSGRPAPAARPAVVVSAMGARLAFLVDRVIDEQELVVKGLGDHLGRVPNIAGVTIMAGGRVVPILNVADLVRDARDQPTPGPSAAPPVDTPRTVLVIDDSITTRTLEKSLLEAAGYCVEVATDGVEALERLERGGIDLVLSDIQMPRMDGFALTERIKKRDATRHIPVVLVSSLAADQERDRGRMAGADAYIVKRHFEQGHLLDVLDRLLGAG